MNELRFGTAGLPIRKPPLKYPEGVVHLRELGKKGDGGLQHLEIEYVYGVRMKKEVAVNVGKLARDNELTLTAHGPYYINLNAKEAKKVGASKKRILDTARRGADAGAFSVTFHPGYYLGMPKEKVFAIIKKRIREIVEQLKQESIHVQLSPETTGKPTQFGSFSELISIAEETEGTGICIDFSHLHARSNGKVNTYREFMEILTTVENRLGTEALKNMHIHLAGIRYTGKGERNHLLLRNSDMNYKDLLKAFHEMEIAGVMVCESPNLQGDSLLLKREYEKLK